MDDHPSLWQIFLLHVVCRDFIADIVGVMFVATGLIWPRAYPDYHQPIPSYIKVSPSYTNRSFISFLINRSSYHRSIDSDFSADEGPESKDMFTLYLD